MPHFLKRLELNGFKSFAGKTTLEFPEGITAIVGPNGSGKSNVVDAIRWLLGERDAKSLRGAKIDDLIFAGTPHKGRVGQAQAALYFENHNKFFPVDFEEVSAARMVNRDGESKYFLNKSEVLLRELVDFFARVRLGSRGLVVVTQGNSDLFIQATPQERRGMLEEILGLKEYQMKRADAQRRLKASTDNLVKVRALIEEITPHLRSLKRQTSRWEKRDEIMRNLAEAEQVFYGSQLQEITAMLSAIDATQEKERGFLEEIATKKNQAASAFAEVESQKPADASRTDALRATTADLLRKKGVLEKESGKLEAQLEHVMRSVEQVVNTEVPASTVLVAHIKDTHKKLKDVLMLENIADVRVAITDMVGSIDALFSSSQKQGVQGNEIVNEGEKIKNELASILAQVNDIEKELGVVADQERQMQQASEGYYTRFKTALSALERAKEEEERAQSRLKTAQFEKERYTMRLQELRRHIEQSGKNEADFIGEKKNVPALSQSQLADAERMIFKLRGDLASMGEADDAVIKEAQETEDRHGFLVKEASDLEVAIVDLQKLIYDLQTKIAEEFDSKLSVINDAFAHFFDLMFGGGKASMVSVVMARKKEGEGDGEQDGGDEEKQPDEMGVEVKVELPRKRIASLDVLSGGERSLVGIAAIFALISVSPPPFLVLDEIDAPLDERNARRFSEMLKEFSKKTQFIVVTHNRVTMEAANVLYGVTLDTDGTSKVVSLKFEGA